MLTYSFLYPSLSANGILDLSSNEDISQKILFTDDEWDVIVAKYSNIPKLHKKKEIAEMFKEINKVRLFFSD
jgi:hypothetical protein